MSNPGRSGFRPIAITIAIAAAASLALPFTTSVAQQEGLPQPTGNASRGKALYEKTYRCYACHGYSGVTGDRVLVPMRWPEAAFVGFVQNSPNPAMPAYSHVPAQDLTDIYAYLRSLEDDSPSVQETGLLNDILRRRQQQ